MIEKLKEYLPIIGFAAIFLSYYDIYNLYQRFGVDIYNYLEPTEIIFSFSSFYSTLVLVIIPLLFANILPEFIPFLKIKTVEKEEMNAKSYKRFTIAAIVIVLLGMMVTGNLIILGTKEYERTGTIDEFELVFFFLMFYSLVALIHRLGIINQKYRSRLTGVKPNEQDAIFFSANVYILLLCLFLFFLINTRNIIKHRNIIKGNPKYSMELKFDDKYVSSSSSFYYIGSTKNYVLFYDSIVKQVKVFPERDIKQSSIKKLRSGM